VLTRTLAGAKGVLLVCVLGALAIAFFHALSTRTAPPPSDDARAWIWVAAGAGMNIYLSPRSSRSHGALVSAWVERRMGRTPASIENTLVELRDFDCVRRTSRRVASVSRFRDFDGREQVMTSKVISEWSPARPATTDERILQAACKR
jgi:hypothetical protein